MSPLPKDKELASWLVRTFLQFTTPAGARVDWDSAPVLAKWKLWEVCNLVVGEAIAPHLVGEVTVERLCWCHERESVHVSKGKKSQKQIKNELERLALSCECT